MEEHDQNKKLFSHLKTLRWRAEKLTAPVIDRDFSSMSAEEVARLVHELETHQIELEMQNMDLFATQDLLVKIRDEYTHLYESAPVGYITLDSKGYILSLNHTFTQMLGKPNLKLNHNKLSDFIQSEDQDIYYKHQLDTLKSRYKQHCELRLNTQSTLPLWVSIESIRSDSTADNTHRILSAIIDISERKIADEALESAKKEAERASEAKTEFLETMSHEIRTPMNGVMGMTSMLLETKLDKEQIKYVEIIDESVNSLVSVLNDILDLSRLEAHKATLNENEFDLIQLVENTISSFRPLALSKSVNLRANYPPALNKSYIGDPGRIRQILINLLSNALKFTDHGEVTIEISLAAENSDNTVIRFEIHDTGKGIPEKEIQNLFNRYYQMDSVKNSNSIGSGLGLAICKELVAMMNGNIGVQSLLKQGSEFWFEIPLQAVNNESSDTQAENLNDAISADEEIPGPSHLRILIAEDEAINQFVARSILESLGHHVEVVDNGVQALKAVNSQRYDLVLMDLKMPEMDGLEATRMIRKSNGPAANTPIIALSATTTNEKIRECEDAGVNLFVTKPINKAGIQQQINKLLKSLS